MKKLLLILLCLPLLFSSCKEEEVAPTNNNSVDPCALLESTLDKTWIAIACSDCDIGEFFIFHSDGTISCNHCGDGHTFDVNNPDCINNSWTVTDVNGIQWTGSITNITDTTCTMTNQLGHYFIFTHTP